jgi:MYXO-CTERM domain-containing protein
MSTLLRALAWAGALFLAFFGCQTPATEPPATEPTAAPADVGFTSAGSGHAAHAGALTARVMDTGAIALEAGATRLELATTAIGGPAQLGARGLVEGVVTIDRGVAEERVRTTAAGVEQSWAFAARPDGELRVTVAARGARAMTRHGDDLVLHVERGAFRYSRATWIDASGRATPIAVTADGGAITMVVPEELLASSSYPALLDPTITPEAPFDAPVAGSNSPNSDDGPAAVRGGSEVLVAWRVTRAGDVTSREIHARRATAAGFVEEAGVLVHAGLGIVGVPAVAWNGSRYLVTWEVGGEIVGARISSAGVLIDTTPIVIASAPGTQRAPAASSDGSDFVVVWQDGRNGADDIYAARVSDAGAVLEPAGIPVSTDALDEGEPAVAFANGDYVVAWDRQGTVQAARVTTAGGVPASAQVTNAGAPVDNVELSFDGANLLVAWRTVAGGAIGGAILSPALGAGAPFAVLASGADRFGVGFDGENHLVAYQAGSLRGLQVTPGGTLVSAGGFDIDASEGSGTTIAVAFDGTSSFVGYSSGDVLGARVSTGGVTTASDLLVSTRANTQTDLSLAVSGVGIHLAAWEDDRGGTSHVFCARFIDEVLDDPPIDLGEGTKPAAAWDGSHFVVVFEQAAGLVARRMQQNGTLDGATLPVTNGPAVEREPAIAAGPGGELLVAWIDNRSGGEDIYAGRLDDGAPLDGDGVLVSAGAEIADAIAVGFAGSYLVTWRRAVSGGGQAIEARVVSSAGAPTGADPLVLSPAALSHGAPATASDGSRHLVAFGYEPAAFSYDLRALLVSASGNIEDTVTLATGGVDTERGGATAAFDGNAYLVGWIEAPSGESGDLLAASVSEAGDVLSTLTVAASDDDEAMPSFASVGNTSAAIYARLEPSPAGPVARAKWRLITPLGLLGEACGDGPACASGFCVDGVCCNDACDEGINACRACSVAAGATVDGTCITLADGAACDDGDLCTASSCSAGVCNIDSLVECSASGECTEPVACDPLAGCSVVPKLDGTPCSNGTCVNGLCTPGEKPEPNVPLPKPEDDGCDCRVGSSRGGPGSALPLLVLLGAGLWLRRRAW